MFTWYKEYKRQREAGYAMRPLWQIPLILPLYLLYLPANWYVEFCDKNL